MAEDSMLWTTSGTGDGPGGGYTQQNWLDFHRYFFTPDVEGSQFILPRKGNKLAATAGASSVNVDTGAAFVYGFFYKNTSSVNVAITTPTLGTTGLRVVLRASWAAQTVRAAVVRNSDGVAGIPAATQTPGTTYEVTLATGTITTGGTVVLTDTRAYLQTATEIHGSMFSASVVDATTIEIASNALRVKDDGISNAKIRNSTALSVIGRSANSTGDPADISATAASGAVLRESGSVLGFGTIATAGIANDAVDDTKAGNRVPQFYRRKGGDASDWSVIGSTNYTPTSVRMQAGGINTAATGLQTVTFPVAFSDKPLVFVSILSGGEVAHTCLASAITTTGFTIYTALATTGADVASAVYWLAIGPE